MDIDITTQQQFSKEGEYNTPYEIDIKSFTDQRSMEKYILSTLEPTKNIQKILLDFETAEFIEEELGPKFNLPVPQKREITRVVRDLLLAKVYLGDMVKIIAEKLDITTESAKQIANELIRLFTPALEDIKKLHIEKFGKKTETAPSSAPATGGINNPNNTVDLRNK
ncbi:MAG: hypothetical protein HYX21_02065 [Candidatus Yanofskybacteria bacterium]|nr:hypothetical protein [Candidatus Yanofskybacteria bacterium]